MLGNARKPQPSIVTAIEAVMMMVVVVVMTKSWGDYDDTRAVRVVMMMMVMMMIELHLLNVFIGGRNRTGLIDDLKQGRCVRNRLKQISK